jgi:protein TonB
VVKKFSDIRILHSSGSDVLDRAAVAAVKKGSPYGTLPQEYKGETLQIVADFHYVLSGDRPRLGRWGYRQSI